MYTHHNLSKIVYILPAIAVQITETFIMYRYGLGTLTSGKLTPHVKQQNLLLNHLSMVNLLKWFG